MRETVKDSELLGKSFSSNFGNFTVLERVQLQSRHKRFLIEFEEINGVKYSYVVTKDNIINKRVKNPYYPSICGVAYSGDIQIKGKELEYNRWKMMVNRCYNKDNKDYKTYGAIGVAVCDRWLCFKSFYEDFSKIDGYDKDNIKNLVLDKDFKSKESKIYSLESCTFIPNLINTKEAYERTRQKCFIAISPDNKTLKGENQRQFALEHNLEPQSINRILRGKGKTHKGWRFYYQEEVSNE